MNKIEKLIKEYCPDGVEYKELGEICISLPKGTLKQTELVENSKYPVINSGKGLYGYYFDYNNEGNTITIASRGEYAGYISFMKNKFWAGGLCYPYTVKDTSLYITKYLFYYLKHKEKYIMDTMVARGSIPALNKKDIEKIEIPIPPIAIQEEIVNILDTFTELEAELEAELVLRKKQYLYYRDKLLDFGTEQDNIVPWISLEDCFYIKNGYTPSKANKNFWFNGNIPWFRMEDIRENGRILSDSIQHITKQAIKGGKLFPANSIIVATTATIGEHALLTVDALANQRFTFLTQKNNIFNMKYFYYYMFIIDEWCKSNTNVSGFASVDMVKFRKLKIPVPPLSEQERIVNILDKFESLVNDISIGLPAEINARQQQYKYYRNKLLSFNKI